MKTYSEYLFRFTDKQIATAVREIMAFHKTGILKPGVTRDFEKVLVKDFHIDDYCSVRVAEDAILMEAGRRFAGILIMDFKKRKSG